jgi:Xaa-Pro dipeptidase
LRPHKKELPMNLPALARLAEYCEEKKLSSVLLSDPATITWITGYAPPIQTGPNPFEGGPALGWWRAGQLTLVLSDSEAGAARTLGIEVREYAGYSIECPPSGFQNQAAGLKDVLREAGSVVGRVGVEFNFLPASLMASLEDLLSSAALVPLDSCLSPLRAVKTPQEVERIRAALALCDLAQAETRGLVRPDVSEIEVWGQVKSRLELAAGRRIPVLADFIGGLRTAEIGGLPGSYVLRTGDPLIADIVPRLNGYWGDNCGTHFVGEPSADLRKAFQAVRGALSAAVAAVRPGVRACDLDAQMRKTIQDGGYPVYPHHSGHGLGTTYHEEPRIVPYNTQPLQPGMVIALEPGAYIPGLGGVRLEDVLLVTDDGCEVLTRHLAQAA